MSQSIHVIALAEALPGHLQEVRELLLELSVLCQQEDGCLRYEVFCDAADPNRINTIEVWSDAASLRRHLDSAYLAQAAMALIGKLKGLPEIRILQPFGPGAE